MARRPNVGDRQQKPPRRPRLQAWTDAGLLAEVRRVAGLIDAPVVKIVAFTALARVHGRTVSIRFGGWGKALAAAGLAHRYGGMVITDAMRERRARRLTDRQLLATLRRVAGRDRVVTVKLLARRASMSVDTFVRRFGSWPEAVRRAGLLQSHLARDRKARDEKGCFIGPPLPPWDTRSISTALRFRILQRDDYRCQLCGDSPAITKGTTLEVDHIHPFSQGGKTTEDNLRTLCRRCNQGKGARV